MAFRSDLGFIFKLCIDHKKPLRKQDKIVQYTGSSGLDIWQRNLDC